MERPAKEKLKIVEIFIHRHSFVKFCNVYVDYYIPLESMLFALSLIFSEEVRVSNS